MEWWQQQQAAAGGNPRLPGDPNFRPGGPGGPGWAMRGGLSPGGGIRGPRPDRRGPGRPRLSSAKLPPGMPGDISGPPIPGAPGRMSPGINRFPPPFGAPPSAIVMPDGTIGPGPVPPDLMPPSPSSSGSGSGGGPASKKRPANRSRPPGLSPGSAAAAALLESAANPGAMLDTVPGPGSGPGTGAGGKVSKGGAANNNKKRYVCEVCQKRFSTGVNTN